MNAKNSGYSEKDICNAIIEFLNYQGFFCWRVNSGSIRSEYKGKTRLIRMAAAGTSDIQGIRKKDGRMICLEIKKPETRRTVTAYQNEYLEKMKLYGAITGVATSPEEALQIVQNYAIR